jgi:hypothetical protein
VERCRGTRLMRSEPVERALLARPKRSARWSVAVRVTNASHFSV